jgi:hypothetical protein
VLAIVLHFDLEAHGLEVIGHELAELGVVVNDEEAHGRCYFLIIGNGMAFREGLYSILTKFSTHDLGA